MHFLKEKTLSWNIKGGIKMKAYISGKITGAEDYEERFEAAEKYLNSKGYEVVNPVKKCSHLPENSAWSDYMKVCVKELADCTHIYMLKDWNNSKGAIVERWLANSLEIEIIFEEFVK